MINLRHVVTGQVRLSYEHIMKPYARNQGDEAKYSTTILLPKSDIATKQRIDAAIEAAKQEGASKSWNGVIPPILAIPVHDGDGVRPSDGMPFGEECKGNWVFTASTKIQPQVVDINGNPIIDASEIYSGMYARVSVDFFAYANNGKKGIGCALGNVQKVSDGEPLASRTSAADDFGAAPVNAAPPQYQQPAQPVQPIYPQQPQYQQAQAAPPVYQQPVYQQPAQPTYQTQAQQPSPQYQVPIDPATGKPIF